MRPVQFHKPICKRCHDYQCLMNCILIGKTPGIEIWMPRDAPKWFSGPDILNFLNYFCTNLPKFDHRGFLSIGLAIFWYNLSEIFFGVLLNPMQVIHCNRLILYGQDRDITLKDSTIHIVYLPVLSPIQEDTKI